MDDAQIELLIRFFDVEFYERANPDVVLSGVDSLDHWIRYGETEGRAPAPWFDTQAYRAEAGLLREHNAFLHLLTTDIAKARRMRAEWTERRILAEGLPRAPVQPYFALAPQPGGAQAVVFTAVAGSRQAMVLNQTRWSDMRLFGDTPLDYEGWTFAPSLYWDPAPKRVALFHKYVAPSLFPQGTKLIWVDSRVSVEADVLERISAELDAADLCVFNHYERDCVYDELKAIVAADRARPEEAADYEARLRAEDFPAHGGLFETGVLGMRTGPTLCRTLCRVFGLARRYIARDQVTLPLALRDAEVRVRVFNEGRTNLRDTPGVTVHPAW